MQNQKPVGRGSFSVIGRSNPPLQVSTQGRGYRLHRESVEQLRDATWYVQVSYFVCCCRECRGASARPHHPYWRGRRDVADPLARAS